MKTALILFLSLLVLPCFSQSKKAINKILWEKHTRLVRQNDSIQKLIADDGKKLMSLSADSHHAERDLFDQQFVFKGIKKDIVAVQKMLLDLGFNPNTLVRQEELDAVYSTYTEEGYDYYMKEVRETRLMPQAFKIVGMEDISQEKLKVRNERLSQKNQEYLAVIDSNLRVIKNQEILESKFNTAIQQMEKASGILYRNKKILKEKYEILRTKCSELELKKEEAELAAENARLEREEKEQEKRDRALSRSSGKKVKTIKFVPPVIIDGEKDYPSERDLTDPDFGNDIMPPPPPPPVLEGKRVQEPVILNVVDEPAEFPGGMAALKKYLADNMVYPQVAKDAGLSGKVYLKFVVSDQGTISNVKVVRGVPDCRECDQEAVRVVKNMPKWIPGKNSGKAVNTFYTLPINFKLSDK